jgi:hypothetical protein
MSFDRHKQPDNADKHIAGTGKVKIDYISKHTTNLQNKKLQNTINNLSFTIDELLQSK